MRLVLGIGEALDRAVDIAGTAWPSGSVQARRLSNYSGAVPDMGSLEPGAWESVFVAAGPDFLNLLRRRLYEAACGSGVTLATLIDARSFVAASALIGENSLVAPGAVIEAGAVVGPNTVIEAGAVVQAGATLGASCWIGARAVIACRARIADNCVVNTGAQVAQGITIGDWCELASGALYQYDVADRTGFHARFSHPVRITG